MHYLSGHESEFATKTDVDEIMGRLGLVLQAIDGMQHRLSEIQQMVSQK